MSKNRYRLAKRFAIWSAQGILLLTATAGILYALDPKEINFDFILRFIVICGLAIGLLYTWIEESYVPGRTKASYKKVTGKESMSLFEVDGTPVLFEHRMKLGILPFPMLSERRFYYTAKEDLGSKDQSMVHEGDTYKLLYSTYGSHKAAVKKLKKMLA